MAFLHIHELIVRLILALGYAVHIKRQSKCRLESKLDKYGGEFSIRLLLIDSLTYGVIIAIIPPYKMTSC